MLKSFFITEIYQLSCLNRKQDSSFQNPTVVAYVHQGDNSQNTDRNESHRTIPPTLSVDSIPSATAAYAEIGSGAWSAVHEPHAYAELSHQPIAPVPEPGPTQNQHARSLPEYIYSKINRKKKKSSQETC